jgi:amino acid adenylation domain-containing protein
MSAGADGAWRGRDADHATDDPCHLDLPRKRGSWAASSFRRGQASSTIDVSGERALGSGFALAFDQRWLTALCVTLFRSTLQRQIVLGRVHANDSEASGAQVGLAVVPVRADAHPGQTVAELAREIGAALAQAGTERVLPGAWLAGPSGRAKIEACFSALGGPGGRASGLTARSLEQVDDVLAACELDLRVERTGETSCVLSCEYDSDRFDAAAISWLLDTWAEVAAHLGGHLDRDISRVPLLPSARREEWLARCHGASKARPACGLHEMVAQQVERSPTAIAVEDHQQRLSYRQLWDRASRVAINLRARGIAPGDRVAICMDRSVDVVPIMLGVLQAGGVYIPLDPAYPVDRRRYVLEDAGAILLVVDGGHGSGHGVFDGSAESQVVEAPTLFVVGSDPDLGRAAPVSWPGARGEALAYIIYTSGSSGRPKGVCITHRGAVNLVLGVAEETGLSAGETWLAVITFAFDMSVPELFVPLFVGGRAWICTKDEISDPRALGGRAALVKPAILQATPATWRMLVMSGWKGDPSLLAISGGEALDASLVDKLRPTVGRLCNGYGPTEITVYATWHEVREPGTAPIGHPLTNVQAFVLDVDGQLLPPGVPGELFVGGTGLATGYQGRDALTKERFVSVPGIPGRLYRTGDLARALPGGDLLWLGRLDDQIKLHGHRIELGEIDAALGGLPGVRQAVAAVKALDADDQRLVAYVVLEAEPASADWQRPLRERLRQTLPDYMVPGLFVRLLALPTTDNGKIDRKALPSPIAAPGAPSFSAATVPPRTSTTSEQQLLQIWKEVLRVDHLGVSDNFFDVGGNSLLLLELQRRTEAALGREIPRVLFFRNPTIQHLAAHLDGEGTAGSAGQAAIGPVGVAGTAATEIAIVGMSLRVPGASTLDQFWDNLLRAVEARTEFSPEELRKSGVSEHLIADPNYVRAGFVLDQVDAFDAGFFGMTPREAEILDPQQRIFLECAWQALEDAGVDLDRDGASTGVFAGVDASAYHDLHVRQLERTSTPAAAFQVRISNQPDFLATRLSYRLNLKGPSLNVQTACSTSLVAIHMAARSLLAGDCTVALAGGVTVRLPQHEGYLYQEGMVASPDGHCRPFDVRAAGAVFGSGAGMVVLKRLQDAEQAGDRIYAVIKGSAINNDGALKVGYTAPGVEGQAQVISAALQMAGVSADSIQYVEAHGTGTPLGDPIEVAALTQAFRRTTDRNGFCSLGSVKGNVGHLDHAAGVIGLVKAALAVHHGMIPPSINFEAANQDIDFSRTPFFVNTAPRPWPAADVPRRAGVSSFGIGGTNAHVIVEAWQGNADAAEAAGEAAQLAGAAEAGAGAEVFTLSARSEGALRELSGLHAAWLRGKGAGAGLRDVCFSASAGRTALEQRAAWVVKDRGELQAALEEHATAGTVGRGWRGVYRNRRPRVAFLFSGQGTQYAGMGRQLYEQEASYREAIEECGGLVEGKLGVKLEDLLYGAEAELLQQTRYAQPALFAVQYALGRTWRRWGVEPQVVLGHSIGEYVAAEAAGVFTLAAGLKLVVRRGELMEQLCAGGAMLSVHAGQAVVQAALARVTSEGLTVSVLNGPNQVVVSGSAAGVEELAAVLRAEGVRSERLAVSHGFHSAAVEPMLQAWQAELEQVAMAAPQVTYVSSMTGEVAGAEVATARYWREQTRQAVRFEAALQTVLRQRPEVLLEVGAQPALLALARAVIDREGPLCLPSLRPGRADREQMLASLAQLHVHGAPVRWENLRRENLHARAPRPRKLSLPSYPFQRTRHWIEAEDRISAVQAAAVAAPSAHSLLGRRLRLPRSNEVRFEAEFRPDWPPYVDDHRLFGTMVVPGASHVAMFLAAGEQHFGAAGCTVKDLLFLRPFVMPEGGRRMVQIVLQADGADRARCELLTLDPEQDESEESSWTVHVTGALLRNREGVTLLDPLESLQAIRRRCQEHLSGADFYGRVWIPGLDTGTSFRWIDEIWRGESEALCRIRRPASLPGVDGPLHAGLIESGFQLLNSCWRFRTEELQKTDYIYVPFSIYRYTLAARPSSENLWVHASIRRQDDQGDKGVSADLRFFDDAGAVVAEVRGFEVRRLHADAVRSLPARNAAASINVHVKTWEPARPAVPVPAPSAGRLTVLVGSRDADLDALTAELSAHGRRCLRVASREIPAPAGFRELLPPAAATDPIEIIYVPGLDRASQIDDPMELQRQLCAPVLALVKALSDRRAPTRLTVITRGAQSAGAAITTDQAAQATLWGLARVVATEHPELGCRTIDLPPPSGHLHSEAALLRQALDAPAEEAEIALRDGQLLVARLQPWANQPAREASLPERLRHDGTYLVTGGLGGLGLRVAKSFVARGAGRVVLVSRRPPDVQRRLELGELETTGVVEVIACDVADEAQLRSCWARVVGVADRPLRGVIHAAGALKDAVLTAFDWETFRVPFAAKVQGAHNLHHLTEGESLDFFVAFSSVSALLGLGGQANYAAANAYLDALMQARRDQGLPGLSIQWGSFAEVGMAAALRPEQQLRAQARGLEAMRPDDALPLMALLQARGPANVAVLAVNWTKFVAALPVVPPLLSALRGSREPLRTARETPPAPSANLALELGRLPRSQWPAVIAERVQMRVARLLGIAADDVDPARGFHDLGLDSLSAIELRSQLQRDFAIALPSTFAFDHGNVEAATAYLTQRMRSEAPFDMSAGVATPSARAEPTASSPPADLGEDVAVELARLELALRGSKQNLEGPG